MKRKSFFSILLSFALIVGLLVPGRFANAAEAAKTQTVTVHKLVMSDDDLDKWNSGTIEANNLYDGSQRLDLRRAQDTLKLSAQPKDVGGVYFALQDKDSHFVDAQGHAYKASQDGATLLKHGQQGYDTSTRYLTTNDAAFAAAKTEMEGAKLAGLTAENSGIQLTTGTLPSGSYKIVELPEYSTYVGPNNETLTNGKAVPVVLTLPMVNKTGVIANAVVYPKNSENKPQIDKNFAREQGLTADDIINKGGFENEASAFGADVANYAKKKAEATAEVGKVFGYEIVTKIPAHAKYQTLTWSDTLTQGLELIKQGTDDQHPFTVKLGAANLDKADYTLTQTLSGFTLTLTPAGVAKVAGKDAEQTITINYYVRTTAAMIVDNPEKNDVTLTYGNHKPKIPVVPTEVRPQDKKITFHKNFARGSELTAEKTFVFDLQVKVGDDWKTVDTARVTINAGQNDFQYTFDGLDNAKTYRVVERQSGYDVTYSGGQNGSVTLTNTKDNTNPPPLQPETPTVVNHGKKFVKTNNVNQGTSSFLRLNGAKFVVYNANQGGKYLAYVDGETNKAQKEASRQAQMNYENAIAQLKTLLAIDAGTRTPEQKAEVTKLQGNSSVAGSIAALKVLRDQAFATASYQYVWKDANPAPTATAPKDAVLLTSNTDGQFEITGLKKGTYYLEELAAPSGYATLQTRVEFTVGSGSSQAGDINYTKVNNETTTKPTTGLDAQKVNNKKIDIPPTGGIGTVVFTVVGLALMAVAVLAMKKRKENA